VHAQKHRPLGVMVQIARPDLSALAGGDARCRSSSQRTK
jgi:hypothetical protein